MGVRPSVLHVILLACVMFPGAPHVSCAAMSTTTKQAPVDAMQVHVIPGSQQLELDSLLEELDTHVDSIQDMHSLEEDEEAIGDCNRPGDPVTGLAICAGIGELRTPREQDKATAMLDCIQNFQGDFTAWHAHYMNAAPPNVDMILDMSGITQRLRFIARSPFAQSFLNWDIADDLWLRVAPSMTKLKYVNALMAEQYQLPEPQHSFIRAPPDGAPTVCIYMPPGGNPCPLLVAAAPALPMPLWPYRALPAVPLNEFLVHYYDYLLHGNDFTFHPLPNGNVIPLAAFSHELNDVGHGDAQWDGDDPALLAHVRTHVRTLGPFAAQHVPANRDDLIDEIIMHVSRLNGAPEIQWIDDLAIFMAFSLIQEEY